MTHAFKAQMKPTQKLVLLAICDSANDQGECYPSVSTLVEKCSASERTVQDCIAGLVREGYLQRVFRNGRSTVYHVTDPRKWRTPADSAPPQILHPTPANPAPPPPQISHPTPANLAPITVNEPSIEPNPKTKRASAPASVGPAELVDHGFTAEVAAEFIAHKLRMKAPLTARAWADHLAESRKAGWAPMLSAEKVMAKNWKGFEAKYVANEARPSASAAEPDWRSERRERTSQFAGRFAEKRPSSSNQSIDMEQSDVARILG